MANKEAKGIVIVACKHSGMQTQWHANTVYTGADKILLLKYILILP